MPPPILFPVTLKLFYKNLKNMKNPQTFAFVTTNTAAKSPNILLKILAFVATQLC